jgi:hypothetical protein
MESSIKTNMEKREGIFVNKEKCTFEFSEKFDVSKNNEKSVFILMSNKDDVVGGITLKEIDNPELSKNYIKLRVIRVDEKYQGGNAVIILYEKAIEYAESLGKKLLFDTQLSVGAYNSFKKLKDYGYDVIENSNVEFDGKNYTNDEWVLRVERKTKKEDEKK